MFVFSTPARAALGDVSAAEGVCLVDTGDKANDPPLIALAQTPPDGATVAGYSVGVAADSTTAVVTVENADGDDIAVPCDEAQLGWDVSVAANGTEAPTVSIKQPTVSIRVDGDTDAIVRAGSTVDVVVSISNFKDKQASRTLMAVDYVTINGALGSFGTQTNFNIAGTSPASGGAAAAFEDGDTAATHRIIVPAGTTPGPYTVSARVIWDMFEDTDNDTNDDNTAADTLGSGEAEVVSVTFDVGDVGSRNLASATLSLGPKTGGEDVATTSIDETTLETGSDISTGDGINLVIEAFNSLGNKANAGGLTQLSVLAFGANISLTTPSPLGRLTEGTAVAADATTGMKDLVTLTAGPGTDGNAGTEDDIVVGQKMFATVTKADGKPGTVEVQARLTGTDGFADTQTITLTFTGDASSISIGDASGSLNNQATDAADDNRDVIVLGVSATDAGGNDSTVPLVTFSITGPDGSGVPTSRIGWARGDVGPNKNAKVTLTSLGTATSPLAAGEYTIKGRRGSAEAEQTFIVAAHASMVDVALDVEGTVEIGDLVTVTATVNDSNGNAVAEKTSVKFLSAGSLKLQGIGADMSGAVNKTTTAGSASARFVVSEGSGKATIIVESGTGSATTSVSTEAVAMADAEVTLACLSETSGFSVYSCSMGSSASELFGLLSGRGATAIHLWNGSSWVRYSVVDGTTVPGSSDFTVADNDILYVSN